MREEGGVKRPIQRSILLGSACFLVALVTLISLTAYFVFSSSLYDRYNKKLKDVIVYVEHISDPDDLARCIETGTHSDAYDELQLLLNEIVDDFELEYLYIVIPSPEIMTNVISATSDAEQATGEEDMELLVTTDAYSTEALQRYLSYWDEEDISYFEETSGYGTYYTAVKPLRDSHGTTIALICADISIGSIRESMLSFLGGSVLVTLLLFGAFSGFANYWLRKNVTIPLLALEKSAREFASKSHDATDVEQLFFVPPNVPPNSEIETLAMSITKMTSDIRSHVNRTLATQAHANEVENENIRLAEEAKAAAKISELSESVTSLFTNMPGPTFSKDARTGVYLACNQAFAQYAHKDSPEGVIGLTDHEIFDKETADHFAEDDRKALTMEEPYVFFEDVLDAAGRPKQFQTTKMKFYDTTGRLCTLGMCVDVTELMSARRETMDAMRAYEKARNASTIYHSIVRALSGDYGILYYVDLNTEQFVTYRQDGVRDDISEEREGEGFFSEGVLKASKFVYPADRDLFVESLTRENVLRSIDELGIFTLSYRIMEDGNPIYVGLKGSRVDTDDHHIIIGVSNIDAQMRQLEAARRAREEHTTYTRIAALSGKYLAIYTVDPDTDHYTQFNATDSYRRLVDLDDGEDFFADALDRADEIVYPDDLGMFQTLFIKSRIMSEVRATGRFVMSFRIKADEGYRFVRLRTALVEEADGPMLVVGISDIDTQMRRDQEFAVVQSKASRDSLTGVKNKHAYVDAEMRIDERIKAGDPVEFAIVVCDLNDLKLTNDTMGHQAGDNRIRQACTIICNVFKHSPVFRVGGDEFSIILQGHDYQCRDELTDELSAINEDNAAADEVVVAWGIGIYQAGDSVATVFSRADSSMYENKRSLKGFQQS